jgi:hypothetical protein
MNSTHPKRKPWPLKKRLKVGAFYGGIILAAALLLGTLIYQVGRLAGMFAPTDLVAAVSLEVQKNPYLISLWQQEAQKITCTNAVKHFALTIAPPQRFTPATKPGEECGEVTWESQGGRAAYIKVVTQDGLSNETIVSRYVDDMSNVVTDIYSHPIVTGTHMYGVMGTMMVRVIVLPFEPQRVLSVVVYPAEADLPLVQKEVIDSLRLLD